MYSTNNHIDYSHNHRNIRDQIMKKLDYSHPYYATNRTVGDTVTDFDDFPYKRWYRGRYDIDKPVIIEREAGYRYVEKNCNVTKADIKGEYPKHCFESACTTVYPCTAEHFKKFASQDAQNIALNRACVYKMP